MAAAGGIGGRGYDGGDTALTSGEAEVGGDVAGDRGRRGGGGGMKSNCSIAPGPDTFKSTSVAGLSEAWVAARDVDDAEGKVALLDCGASKCWLA